MQIADSAEGQPFIGAPFLRVLAQRSRGDGCQWIQARRPKQRLKERWSDDEIFHR